MGVAVFPHRFAYEDRLDPHPRRPRRESDGPWLVGSRRRTQGTWARGPKLKSFLQEGRGSERNGAGEGTEFPDEWKVFGKSSRKSVVGNHWEDFRAAVEANTWLVPWSQ